MYADICKMLNIKYPIIQGAMAWISDQALFPRCQMREDLAV